MTQSNAFIEATLDLAWSHWTALGVAGVQSPPNTAVDPESLLILTAALGDLDPRLRDEATDWCIRYAQRFISLSRLRNLLSLVDERTRLAFEDLTAIVNDHAHTRWPSSSSPREFVPSGKSRLQTMNHPSQALLRFRCIFGTTARAELLLTFLTMRDPQSWTRPAALAELGYGKRNIAAVLDDLSMAELVEARRIDNANAFRIRSPAALRKALEPLPLAAGRWHLRMVLLADFVSLAQRIERKSAVVQAVEARKLVTRHESTMARMDLGAPTPQDPPRYWAQVRAWLVEKVVMDR